MTREAAIIALAESGRLVYDLELAEWCDGDDPLPGRMGETAERMCQAGELAEHWPAPLPDAPPIDMSSPIQPF